MEKINKYLQEARKEKDAFKIKFYSTLKGEIESELKRSTLSQEQIIESIAKKWKKNLDSMLISEEINREIILLKEFLPESMSEEQMEIIFKKVKETNNLDFEAYYNGNDRMIGKLMGLLMKESGGKANPDFMKTLIFNK